MVFLNEKEEKDMCKINSDFINIVMRYKLMRDFLEYLILIICTLLAREE